MILLHPQVRLQLIVVSYIDPQFIYFIKCMFELSIVDLIRTIDAYNGFEKLFVTGGHMADKDT